MHSTIMLLLLLSGVSPPEIGPARDGGPLRMASQTFAYQTGADGAEYAVVLDDDGSVRRSISLKNHVATVGPAEVIAVLDRDADADHREVLLLDSSGRTIQRFEIAAKHEVCLGERMLAVIPRGGCVAGTAYSIEFRGMNGAVLARHQIAGMHLLELVRHDGDHWIALARAGGGQIVIYHYRPDGQLAWKFDTHDPSSPVVGLSASGATASVGVMLSGGRTSRHSLLDQTGVVVKEMDRPMFQMSRFSSDEKSLALAGDDALQLIDVRDGTGQWLVRRDWQFAPGQALEFSADGKSLLVGTRIAEQGRTRLDFYRVPIDAPRPESLIRRVGSTQIGDARRILEMEGIGGRIRVITDSAITNVRAEEGR